MIIELEHIDRINLRLCPTTLTLVDEDGVKLVTIEL